MALALVVRLGVAFVFAEPLARAVETGIAWDGTLSYTPLAENLLAGNGLGIRPGTPAASHMPLYPALLALGIRATGSVDTAVVALQPVLGALAVGVLYLLACALVGRVAGNVAALLAVFSPDLVSYSLLNLSETPHLLATLVASVAMLAALRRPRARTGVALGLSLGAALMIRESSAPLIALWALALTPVAVRITARRFGQVGQTQPQVGQPQRGWRVPAICLAIVVALLVPWWLRNWSAFGEFVPFTTKGSWNVYQGTLLRPYPVTDHRSVEMELDPETAAREADVLLRKDRAASLSEVNRIFLQATLANVRRDPIGQLRHLGRKLVWLWSPNIAPRHAAGVGAPWVLWGAAVAHFAGLGLGLLGLAVLRRRAEVFVILTLPLLTYTSFYVAIGGAEPRYHFGAWPALLIGTAALLTLATHKIRSGIGRVGAD